MLHSKQRDTLFENLPNIIFRDYIFKFLSHKDVFNLGMCSKTLKRHVIHETSHPLTTSLQCLKTMSKYYHKIDSIFDDIEAFHCFKKCGNPVCSYRSYLQRKNFVIMDPSWCPSCDEYLLTGYYATDYFGTPSPANMGTPVKHSIALTPCIYHCTLMLEMFDLNMCNDCLEIGTLCKSCNDMLDK